MMQLGIRLQKPQGIDLKTERVAVILELAGHFDGSTFSRGAGYIGRQVEKQRALLELHRIPRKRGIASLDSQRLADPAPPFPLVFKKFRNREFTNIGSPTLRQLPAEPDQQPDRQPQTDPAPSPPRNVLALSHGDPPTKVA
jgi:hypothetical protein